MLELSGLLVVGFNTRYSTIQRSRANRKQNISCVRDNGWGVKVHNLIKTVHYFGEIRVRFSRVTDCRLTKRMSLFGVTSHELLTTPINPGSKLVGLLLTKWE